MTNSKRKGNRGELEFSKLVGGKKVPLSGAMRNEEDFTNDVILPNGWETEVKRFKDGEKTLYGWILDPIERPDVVAFRADKKPWVVCMHLGNFNRLLGLHIASSEILKYIDPEDGLIIPGMYDEFAEASKNLSAAIAAAMRESAEQWEKTKEKQTPED